jgi:SEC-C motif
VTTEIGRNDPCHCGSGKKYKQCHLAADEAKAREARRKAEAAAPAEAAPAAGAATQAAPRKPPSPQPWKRGTQNTRGFARVSATRKVGGS